MPKKDVLTDVVFTDTTLPLIYPDSLMKKGALFLWDPGHSQGGFTGVPGVGAVMPNIAWESAKALIGAGDAASLGSPVLVKTANAAGNFMTERSAKGGVHGMSSQSTQAGTNQSWVAGIPALIRTYLETVFADNAVAHGLYGSVWYRSTRVPLLATANQSHFHWCRNTSDSVFLTQGGYPSPAAGKSLGAYANTGTTYPAANDLVVPAGTPKHLALGVSGWQGAAPAAWATKYFQFGVGGFDSWATFMQNKAGSVLLYRVYLENLLVSERTYAQALAEDQAMFTKEVLTVGGKYYGDTWSDPATLVP